MISEANDPQNFAKATGGTYSPSQATASRVTGQAGNRTAWQGDMAISEANDPQAFQAAMGGGTTTQTFQSPSTRSQSTFDMSLYRPPQPQSAPQQSAPQQSQSTQSPQQQSDYGMGFGSQMGQAQPREPQSQGTPYRPQVTAQEYRPSRNTTSQPAASQLSTQPYSPQQSASQPAARQSMQPSGFATQMTDPFGKATTPEQYYPQQDAFVSQLIGRLGQNQSGTWLGAGAPPPNWGKAPALDLGGMWGNASKMVDQGWTNPFAAPGAGSPYAQPPRIDTPPAQQAPVAPRFGPPGAAQPRQPQSFGDPYPSVPQTPMPINRPWNTYPELPPVLQLPPELMPRNPFGAPEQDFGPNYRPDAPPMTREQFDRRRNRMTADSQPIDAYDSYEDYVMYPLPYYRPDSPPMAREQFDRRQIGMTDDYQTIDAYGWRPSRMQLTPGPRPNTWLNPDVPGGLIDRSWMYDNNGNQIASFLR
jgi:uncharacterized short protein YbdD (DUF466 family)